MDGPAIDDEIVIVGMGLAVPGASDPEEYWQELLHGGECFLDVPSGRWDNTNFYSADRSATDKTYSRKSAFITDAYQRETEELASCGGEYGTIWLRHALRQALSGVHRNDDDASALLVGYTADGSQHLEEAAVVASLRCRGLSRLDSSEASGADRQVRLENALRRRYPRSGDDPSRFLPHNVGRTAMSGILPEATELLMIDTACSSSLYTIDLGAKGLREGRYDIAVCGGAFSMGPRGSVLFAKLGGLSATGEVRALDVDSDGVLFADGAAVVVLKRLSRARADGDRILASVQSFGCSSDGRGKAIYAPNEHGQELAIRRSWDAAGPVRPGLVIAHATGTKAGDLAEMNALRDTYGSGEGAAEVRVTSNKSVIGHLGWAAGAASAIEAVLALNHGVIPPQQRLRVTDPSFDLGSLTVPTEPVAWVSGTHRRQVALSGFGFGGTNAHLVIAEPPLPQLPVEPPTRERPDERIAVVAFSSHRPETGVNFGDAYPLPSLKEVVLPPALLRGIDRTQLMALRSATQLKADLGEFWTRHAATTGVVMGHLGLTRNSVLYATRCYADDLRKMATTDPDLVDQSWADELLRQVQDEVAALVPESSEFTFPGMMPNVIPARVANYLNLNGLNLTVDAGLESFTAAIDVATRYLRSGELTMALAGAINGNATPEAAEMLASLLPDGSATPLAEGCFMLALVPERLATTAGLRVHGILDPVTGGLEGQGVPDADPSFLGAATCPAVFRQLTKPAAPKRVTAYNVRGVARDGAPLFTPSAFWPSAGQGVLLTNSTGFAHEAMLRGIHVITPGQSMETDIATSLADGTGPVQVRVVVECTSPDGDVATDQVHAGTFLIGQVLADRLDLAGSSMIVVTTGPLTGPEATPVPLVGLFRGLTKVMHLEYAAALVFHLACDTDDPATVAGLVERESQYARILPTVRYQGSTRYVDELARSEPTPAVSRPFLSRDSLVIAVGGGRGITAEILIDLAQRVGPEIVVIGSTELDAQPLTWMWLEADEFDDARPRFIREWLKCGAGTVKEASAAYDRVANARRTATTLELLETCCGTGRVHYLAADARDSSALREAIAAARKLTGHRPVDLLINAAGLNRSALIRRKPLSQFLQVRDLRLFGYRNLKQAFGQDRPRLWLNFGSLLGVTGHRGEADYASVNDFLASAAEYRPADEYTIGWTLWTEAGMGAAGLIQAYFERSEMYSGISSAEGCQLFSDELARAQCAALPRVSIHVGANEARTVNRMVPGFVPAVLAPGTDPSGTRMGPVARPRGPIRSAPPRSVGRTRVIERTEDRLVLERSFSLEHDGYLKDHTVRGVPTVPGMFIADIACAAAEEFMPGMVAFSLVNVVFHHFLKVYSTQPSVRRITVSRQRSGPDGAEVSVRVTGDVVSPKGVVLVRDRPHFTANVLLSQALPPHPTWRPWPRLTEAPVPDPYYVDGSMVRLTGPFVSSRDPRLHPWGKRATAELSAVAEVPGLADMIRPCILLDALARTGALAEEQDGRVPLAVPLGVSRVDFFEVGNDAQFAARHPQLALFAVVEEDPEMVRNHFAAVTPDGNVVARLRDLRWELLGHVETATGAFHPRQLHQPVVLGQP